jgi:catecholate siderophore receptor
MAADRIAILPFQLRKILQPFRRAFNLTAATGNIGSEQNHNLELGAKIDFFNNRLSLTGAAFRLEKTNAGTVNPLDR